MSGSDEEELRFLEGASKPIREPAQAAGDHPASLSQESGIPYQTLMNLYLRECASSGKRLVLTWKSVA